MEKREIVTVGVVDDHHLMMDGLKLLVESMDGFRCVWTTDNAADCLARVEAKPPDMVLVDITMPDRNGIELIKDLRKLCPEVKLLVISMHDEEVYAQRALKAGARGYVMKSASHDEIRDTLLRVAEGRLGVSDDLSERMVEAFFSGQEASDRDLVGNLSDREFEVFQLVGECKTAAQIGEALGISSKTVDVYKSKIRGKLDIKPGDSLAAYAIRWVELKKIG
ncbi:MAG: response regulator transcription factor [Verrucomicrobiales bacterium]|nr:response regulator transcription factor [Verrucomicrobiales bacterium]